MFQAFHNSHTAPHNWDFSKAAVLSRNDGPQASHSFSYGGG